MVMDNLVDKIKQLREEKNAVIMAHYYQTSDIQDIADYVGDSLALAQQAAKTNADIIVLCGVHFMGETAKNIRAAFECAKRVDAVLFFYEADTLLGARLSNVTQGIDNEVNSLRSTLLIELEKFEGIVIFATNFEKNYDIIY